MEKEEEMTLKDLEEQLQRSKQQDRVLGEIETKLYKMKEIAEYATANELNFVETKKLQGEMDQLKEEVESLEKQLEK